MNTRIIENLLSFLFSPLLLHLLRFSQYHLCHFISVADGVLVSWYLDVTLTSALNTHFGWEALCHSALMFLFDFLQSLLFLIRSLTISQPSWIGCSATSFLRFGPGQLAFIGFYLITTVGPRQGGQKTEMTFLKRHIIHGENQFT